VPFQSSFHASFFPENELATASAKPNLSLSRFQKQMRILSEINIAQTALEQGDTKEASKYLKRIRKDAKYEASFHMMEALVKTKMDDDIGARESIDEAITIAPDDPKVILAAARIQRRMGKPSEVLKTLRRLKREKYASPNAFALEARAYLEKGDLPAAERALKRATAINALDGEVMGAFIFFHHEAADITSALAQADQLYKIHRAEFETSALGSPVLHAYYCGALAKNNKIDEAISTLEKLSKEFEDTAIIHYFLGSAYLKKGNRKKSRRAFNEVKRIGGPVEKWAAEN
jgi:predicted Zn-dependent protease